MIDATPSSSTMNCYTDVAFADAYFALRYGAEAWVDFDTTKKEALLVRATNTLDTFKFGGLKTSRTQPLLWPRQGIFDDEGYWYDKTVVPVKVQKATCELALWYWTEDDRFFSDIELSQLESWKAGPADVKAKKGALDLPKTVMELLTSIGTGVFLGTNDTSGPRSLTMHL
jgi:hypothetical protein